MVAILGGQPRPSRPRDAAAPPARIPRQLHLDARRRGWALRGGGSGRGGAGARGGERAGEAAGIEPAMLLLTHHHADHIGGAAELLQRWPGMPVFAPADDRIDLPCTRVGDGDVAAGGPWRFEAIEVPGHTLSHVAFTGHGVLFCGDTLFSLGCGRLFEGSPAQMLASLDRLAALPGATQVCCGHEYTLAN